MPSKVPWATSCRPDPWRSREVGPELVRPPSASSGGASACGPWCGSAGRPPAAGSGAATVAPCGSRPGPTPAPKRRSPNRRGRPRPRRGGPWPRVVALEVHDGAGVPQASIEPVGGYQHRGIERIVVEDGDVDDGLAGSHPARMLPRGGGRQPAVTPGDRRAVPGLPAPSAASGGRTAAVSRGSGFPAASAWPKRRRAAASGRG